MVTCFLSHITSFFTFGRAPGPVSSFLGCQFPLSSELFDFLPCSTQPEHYIHVFLWQHKVCIYMRVSFPENFLLSVQQGFVTYVFLSQYPARHLISKKDSYMLNGPSTKFAIDFCPYRKIRKISSALFIYGLKI